MRALWRGAFEGEAGAAVLLVLVATVAMALANSPWAAAWTRLLDGPLPQPDLPRILLLPLSSLPLASVHAWVNEGLMAVFFFTVGLEIKREVRVGDLAHGPTRRLPVLAAAAGMTGPVLVFMARLLLGRSGGDAAGLGRGWAIPAATDIAFALGVLGLLGRRVPASLRLFLLTVAVVDDLGAAAIIALAYPGPISGDWLAGAGLVLAAMAALNLAGVRRGWPFAVLAVVLWGCVLRSGIHPTVAGVLGAFAVPLAREAGHGHGHHTGGRSPLLRMEALLAPWSAYVIVPLFGLANAGVQVTAGAWSGRLTLAVAAGLALGKQAGIFGAVLLAERLGLATRPRGASRMQLWGVSLLGGIGFTMSLLLATLAFPAAPALVAQAKLGILAGSLVSAVLGYVVLWRAGRARPPG